MQGFNITLVQPKFRLRAVIIKKIKEATAALVPVDHQSQQRCTRQCLHGERPQRVAMIFIVTFRVSIGKTDGNINRPSPLKLTRAHVIQDNPLLLILHAPLDGVRVTFASFTRREQLKWLHVCIIIQQRFQAFEKVLAWHNDC